MTDLADRCASAGLKMTDQRRTILRVLDEAMDHPSVETVYERARQVDPAISIATVYRTLSLLDEMDLIVRHEFKENFSRYETNLDHHHHLIDLETGKVIEFCDAHDATNSTRVSSLNDCTSAREGGDEIHAPVMIQRMRLS